MKTKIAITLICIVSILSCEKENHDYDLYRAAETGCADKWGVYANKSESELANAVKSYLQDNSVVFDRIVVGFDSSLVQLCKSCLCTTGRYIEVSAPPEENDILNKHGFYKMKMD